MPSPTALSLTRLRELGFAAGVVERWIESKGIRSDFLRCIDVVAAKPGEPILGVQATALSCISARLTKARSIRELATWLAAGAAFQVWGWGKVRGRWAVKIVELQVGDMEARVVQPMPRRRRRSRWQPGDLFLFSDLDDKAPSGTS
jgi:hypothetical protein